MHTKFYVRTGNGSVKNDGTFTDVVEAVTRVVRQHVGWQSVRYNGSRYQLFGGIRTSQFIDLANPILKR